MNISTVQPGSTFAPYVESFIYYTDYHPEHHIERVIPDGRVYLVVELDGRPRHVYNNESLAPKATYVEGWVSGPQRSYLSIEAVEDSSMFVIMFRSAGVRPFLSTAVDVLVDRVLPASDLFADAAALLRRRLQDAESPDAAAAVAEEWLGDQFDQAAVPSSWVYDAVEGIRSDPGFARTSLATLVSDSGYSRKQFIHLFKESVGLTPKVFQRIVRFNEILPRIVSKETVSWPDISAECGYYDQSHFIREFKQFSGYNPGEFLRGTPGDRTNFFPIE